MPRKFLAWIETEFGWGRSTAENFMNVFQRVKLPNFGNLEIDVSALYLIAAPKTPEPVRAEVMRRAASGEAGSNTIPSAVIGGRVNPHFCPAQRRKSKRVPQA